MKLIEKEESWFLSKNGFEKYSMLSSLEERTVFIYSYLKMVVNMCFENDNTLFKMAFLFADAIYNSDVQYALYPQIIQQENPFFAYLQNADNCLDNKNMYIVLTSILHDKVDPKKMGEWIYDKEFWEDEDLGERLEEKGIAYLSADSINMTDPSIYEMDSTKELIQLELAWLFLK